MFDIPGFYPSSMTDDELMKKQAELSRKLSWANRFSTSTDMAGQLWGMISAIEAERRDRVLRIMYNERDKMFPEIIETEPDLAIEHKRKIAVAEEESKMSMRRKAGRERPTLSKSSMPVNQIQMDITAAPKTATPTPDPEDSTDDE